MTLFNVAHTEADDWATAVRACANSLGGNPIGDNLGFVYVTDELAANLSEIHAFLIKATGIRHWVGSVGLGICADSFEYFGRPAMAVMTASLPEDAFRVFPTLEGYPNGLDAEAQDWIKKASPRFGIVHGDPNNPIIPDLLDELSDVSSTFLVGGLTASQSQGNHQVAGSITGGGLSGVLFSPEVKVATGLTQGCEPIAESHLISDCVDNIIIGLDGRQALDVFNEDIGQEMSQDLNQVAGYIHAAIPIEGTDTGDYMVRNLIAIDPVRGWLAIGGLLEPGGRVMFVRRDPKSASADLKNMLTKLKHRLGGPPRGGVYFSCLARGPSLFGEEGQEMSLIRENLGDMPLVGFYAGGEINNNRLYAYTGVLSLFL